MAGTTDEPEDYEELFAHRFTSEDHEYQEYLKRPPDPPPIVQNWRGRGGGSHRGGRDNRYRDRDRDRTYGRDRDRDRSPHRDRERSWDGERDRGYRGGYQRSSQGYSSQHQRPQYDRY
uniref:RNA guanine-7 methyltransferase activating subunit n=1 Tax=Neogobius melanostomus TaxID=47308 RepID=A0A8C6UGQ0_9GOBI